MSHVVLVNTSDIYFTVPVVNTMSNEKDTVDLMPNGGRAQLAQGVDVDAVWLAANPAVARHVVASPLPDNPSASIDPSLIVTDDA